jgi:hypothetical protein
MIRMSISRLGFFLGEVQSCAECGVVQVADHEQDAAQPRLGHVRAAEGAADGTAVLVASSTDGWNLRRRYKERENE